MSSGALTVLNRTGEVGFALKPFCALPYLKNATMIRTAEAAHEQLVGIYET